MKRLRGRSKKAVAEGTVTWCVRLLPTVPRPVPGSYGSPMPESSRRRVLLNVQEARNTGSRAKRDIFALLNDREKQARGLRLSPNHTTETGAESAIRAASARNAVWIGVSLADVCGGRGIGMIAERFGGVAKQRSKIGNFCRRRGIFLAAPALKNIAAVDPFTADVARLARRAEHFVDACIVRLQFVVSDA